MSLKKRIKNSNKELYTRRQALHESLQSVCTVPNTRVLMGGVLVSSFVLGILAQRLIVSPGKTLSSCARVALSPLSVFRLF